MSSWEDMRDGIIAKIDDYFERSGWVKDADDEWTIDLVTREPEYTYEIQLIDIRVYIGKVPFETIMNENHVYGSGSEGIAAFITETYASDFEDNVAEVVGLSDAENDWMCEDEDNWYAISEYIQWKCSPKMDKREVSRWLANALYS